jgi:tetratricopeptide (TPR) repeat protein
LARINIKIREVYKKPLAVQKSLIESLQKDLVRVLVLRSTVGAEMALLYERQGDYESATLSCRETLSIFQHQTLDDEIIEDIQRVEDLCSGMDSMIKRLEQTEAYLQDRKGTLLKMHTQISETDDPEERKKLCERFEKKATTLLEHDWESLGETHLQVTGTLEFLSTVSLEQGKPFLTIKHLQKALEICKATLGTKHPRTGQYFLRIAEIYRDQGQQVLALRNFTFAADVLVHSNQLFGKMGSVFIDMAVIRMREGEYDTATSVLLEALSHYKAEVVEKGDDRVTANALRVWLNLGECYFEQMCYEDAKDAYTNALKMQRSAREIHDMVADVGLGVLGIDKQLFQLVSDEKIADSLGRLAKTSASLGIYQEALGFYSEALTLLKRVSIANELSAASSLEEVLATRNQLCQTLYGIAELSKIMRDYESALQTYRESIQYSHFNVMNTDTNFPSAVHCAKCFMGIGDVHLEKEEFVAAHKQYTDTLAYCKKRGIPKGHELVCSIESKLEDTVKRLAVEGTERKLQVNVLEERAEKEMNRRDYDEALSTLRNALSLQSASLMHLKLTGEDTSAQVRVAASLLLKLGSLYLEKGNVENAERVSIEVDRLFMEFGVCKCGLVSIWQCSRSGQKRSNSATL